MVFKKSVYFQWRINLENKIYLKQNISTEQVESGEINGVAYSGAVIPNYMFYKNFIVDLSTLTVAKKKTPIFRDHLASQVAGHGAVEISDSGVTIKGKISKKTPFGREIIDLAEDDFEWEQSIGVFDGTVEEVENAVVNGHEIAHAFVLRNGVIREVSIVGLGADMNTNAQIFNVNQGDHNNMKLSQHTDWVKFACACGGSKESTPEELETKFKASEEEIKAKQAEIEEKQAEIDKLKSELDKMKSQDEEKEREAELSAAIKEKNLEFSAEKIKDAAKTKEKTEFMLSIIKDMKAADKKIDQKFTQNVDLSKDASIKAKNDAQEIRLKAEQLVKEGKATNFLEAIDMVEVK